VKLKTASFHVRSTMAQSVAWKVAAEREGHASVGSWLADAADRHLDAIRRAGKPLALAWRKGRFRVALEGRETELPGFVSPPFGVFRGTAVGRGIAGCHRYTLVYVPQARILATFRTSAQCRLLASELARLWVRWGGSEPTEDPAPLLQRFQREDV
jgi:hypothetical protein